MPREKHSVYTCSDNTVNFMQTEAKQVLINLTTFNQLLGVTAILASSLMLVLAMFATCNVTID